MSQKIEPVINLNIAVKDTAIPEPVIENMIRVGDIPTREVNWADERKWCKHALRQAQDTTIRDNAQAATTCLNLRRDSGRQWCSLNGPDQASPCIFDEPESARVWQQIKAYVDDCKQRGWM